MVGVLIVAAAVTAALVLGAGTLMPGPDRTISGALVITAAGSSTLSRQDEGCTGVGQFENVSVGAQVTFRDADGKLVGTGTLASSEVVDATFLPLPKDWATDTTVNVLQYGEQLRTCRFTFAVADIADAPFYSIGIADRNPVTYSREELSSMGWTIELELTE